MKKFLFSLAGVMVIAVMVVLAGDDNKVSNITKGIAGQGGTSSGITSLNTFVVSNNPTNEYKIVTTEAVATGGATSATNQFGVTYLAAPTVVKGMASGAASGQITNAALYVGITVTTTNVIVTGISTNAATGVSNLPLVVYGYTRRGSRSE